MINRMLKGKRPASRAIYNQPRIQIFQQYLRFGLAGAVITVAVAAVYWAVAEFGGIDPMLSMALVYVGFIGIGYRLHSSWSFGGFGTRDNPARRTVRFIAVTLIDFASNQFFVWLLTKYLNGPNWWPVVPVVFVTPFLTFALNRKWVFS